MHKALLIGLAILALLTFVHADAFVVDPIVEHAKPNGTINIGSISPGEKIELMVNNAEQLPKEFEINQNYPNPFNPSTLIRYSVPENSYVTLKVYDVLGREVAQLQGGVQEAGYKTVQWDARQSASGIYFYKIEATSVTDAGKRFSQARKMLLMK